MPEKLSENSDGTYKVTGPHGTHSKGATKENAEKQIKLLNAIDHGFEPNRKGNFSSRTEATEERMETTRNEKSRMKEGSKKEEARESKAEERAEQKMMKKEKVAKGGTKGNRSGGEMGDFHSKRSAKMGAVLLALALCLFSGSAWACNFASFPSVVSVVTSPSPFGVAFSPDQCYVFVGVTMADGVAAVNVYVNTGTTLAYHHTAYFKAGTGANLLVDSVRANVFFAGNHWIGKVSLADLIAGSPAPLYWDDPIPGAGITNLVMLTSWGALIANEEGNSALVGVNGANMTFLGRLGTDIAPLGMAWNADQSILYWTSQYALPARGWANTCPNEASSDPTLRHPYGVLSAWVLSPGYVVSVPAGCVPVRTVFASPFIYTTLRQDGVIKVWDTNLTLQQSISTGPAPVGLASKPPYIISTDSNRWVFPNPPSYARAYTVDGGYLYFSYYIAEGAFPREVVTSPDGSVIAVTNASSNTLQINKF